MNAAYAELHCHSNFSFLEGASHVESLVERAMQLHYRALALTDRDGLYGAAGFHRACSESGLKPIYGAELTLTSGHHVSLLVKNARGWSNLTQLLTTARMRCKKGSAAATFEELAGRAEGLIVLSGCSKGELPEALLKGDEAAACRIAERYRSTFGNGFYLELQSLLGAEDEQLMARLEWLGRRLKIRRVATGNVHFAAPGDRRLQDVLTAIAHKTDLDRAGTLLHANDDRFLKPVEEIVHRFRRFPEAVANTLRIAERCEFSLGELSYRFPAFDVPPPDTPFSYLHRLVQDGSRTRYRPLTPKAARQIAYEVDVIQRLDLAGYFLIVWDIVRFAREQGILCQGRGSAANSAVCYCLGITSVDPVGLDLLFERFISEERQETPDIDIDFAHREREKVIQYVYERYGRDHAGMVCEFISYRGRSAVRDVGKALGLSLAQVEQVTETLEARRASAAAEELRSIADHDRPRQRQGVGLDLDGPRMQHLIELVDAIDRFPRHLSIHVGGMVITERPLSEVVPIENAAMQGRSVIQWDKDDLAQLGIIKIDLLGLGMLTVLQDTIALVQEHEGLRIDLSQLGCDDPEVYDMICAADTIGLFQIESRAQMNTLPRLKPRCFYDLVVEVALIRPGPIQGEMVHPYLRRRAGKEPVTYPHPSLEPILKRTLGIPLFQEQGMKLAITAAGFTAGEADELRRAMGHKRSQERMDRLAKRLLEGMLKNGIDADTAARIFKQLAAFASYGFPESHAASFALLVYASAYLKKYHHAPFTAATLNAQPMGFYSPATLINDAKRHGVKFRPIDAQKSDYDCTLEDGAVRIGLRYVRGVGEQVREPFERARRQTLFESPEDFVRRSGLPRAALENLALLGGFRGFGLEPRPALWQVQALTRKSPGPLADVRPREPHVPLPPLTEAETLEVEYGLSGLSTTRQPLRLFRTFLDRKQVIRSRDLPKARNGRLLRTAGLVICRQRPPTAKGFTFLTLEDETGTTNVVVRPDVYEQHRQLIRSAPLIVVDGLLEKVDGVINLQATHFYRLGSHAPTTPRSHDYH